VPALRSFFQVWSFGPGLEPFVEFYRPGGEELTLVHSIQQMFAVGTAADVSWRPDLYCRHTSANGVDNLGRDALRFLGARLGFL